MKQWIAPSKGLLLGIESIEEIQMRACLILVGDKKYPRQIHDINLMADTFAKEEVKRK